ncbi:MAG: rRNA maturation RNase YbeY [Gammaproteobacteria bacterium]|nr:rRNA maturation RNase YbeY [Gammaproteobacteria bacterium]
MAIQAEVQRALSSSGVPSAERFQCWAKAIDHPTEVSACIRVVDEAEMEQLNERYRGKSGATNVLAFEADQAEREQGCLGDVVICAPEVFREARQYGHAPEARFAHMTIHGLLHLLGYGHDDAGTAACMEGMERAAMERLGYSNPYELG